LDVGSLRGARDQYCGPQGHPLPLARSKRTEGVVVYRGDPGICNTCPVKTSCTTSDRGRTIQRSIYESYLETVRSYHATEPYKKAIRKRQVWAEPLFAEAKEWHGLRRLRLRGLLNANIQGLLIASGQNLKRFLAATGWGRRHAPCGSLLRTEDCELKAGWAVQTSAFGGFFQRPEPFDDSLRASARRQAVWPGVACLDGPCDDTS
ncbi:MAG TPA: transposase, partial [Candidatus Limnocylindria bacterium]|nr:transposase [Candidatus Limnocylindria bacterium]